MQTTKPFKIAVDVQHKALAYEITQESKPSMDLLRGPLSTKYPDRIGNFDGVQASDLTYMHVVADAHLVDSKGKQVGNPN